MHRSIIALASLALAAFPSWVIAQSTSGNIAGEAKTGDTIVVTNTDTGFKRELKIDKDGKYQVRRVPLGEYQVIRVRKDGHIDPAQTVSIRPDATVRIANPNPDEAAQGGLSGAGVN